MLKLEISIVMEPVREAVTGSDSVTVVTTVPVMLVNAPTTFPSPLYYMISSHKYVEAFVVSDSESDLQETAAVLINTGSYHGG